jgi:hypothetical protein
MECWLVWWIGPPIPPYFGCNHQLATAYADQCLIGWDCFLEGRMAKSCLPVQAAYLSSQGLRKMANTWVTNLACQLWKVAFKMWQHCNTWQHDESNPENC